MWLQQALGSPNGNRTRVFAVRGRYPRPLDDGTVLAGGEGFEPSLTGPEPAVLPLNDPPALVHNLANCGPNVKDKNRSRTGLAELAKSLEIEARNHGCGAR